MNTTDSKAKPSHLENAKTKISKSVEFLTHELAQIRAGRASPSLVENIGVDVYGSKMTIKELGSISILDPQNLSISPWDKSILKDIVKALSQSDLQVNSMIDGDHIRVPFPSLTEDRRKELVKTVSVKVEDCKNSIRNIRQDAMKDIDADFSNKMFGEDEKFTKREEIEKVTKEFSGQADTLGENKKADLMKV